MWEDHRIRIIDDDHVWIGSEQYVSLRRFNEVRYDQVEEAKNYRDRIDELYEENKALRVLLGLPKEGPLGMNVENTETFFDDSEKEAKDGACEYFCDWVHDSYGCRKTTCGFLISEVLASYDLKYCPHCGKKISHIDFASKLLNHESEEEAKEE